MERARRKLAKAREEYARNMQCLRDYRLFSLDKGRFFAAIPARMHVYDKKMVLFCYYITTFTIKDRHFLMQSWIKPIDRYN